MSFQCVKGDLTQSMPLTISANGAAVNLTTATSIQLRWTKPDGTTTLVGLTAVNLAAGEVRRVWVAGDTDLAGAHFGQVVVTTGTTVETFPNDGSRVIWWIYPQTGSC